jgi:hypothetical protein
LWEPEQWIHKKHHKRWNWRRFDETKQLLTSCQNCPNPAIKRDQVYSQKHYEYCKKKYEVETTSEGFMCKGLLYKSLSALATKITGHKTNGLLFFGVKK